MTNGFHVKDYGQPVKRYVQTMDLKDDPELIAEYRRRHTKEESWQEIRDGISEVGILDMQIFILGTRLVMIVETGLDFDWDSAMARLATLPRQQEWEDYMAIFQQCAEGATSVTAPCFSSSLCTKVPRAGVEPARVAPLVFETSASTDSAIWASK